jgi:HK97 family phage prohead protease
MTRTQYPISPARRLALPHHLETRKTPELQLQQRQTRSYALQIKATGDDGTIEGYGSVFGVVDSYDDSIVPGAFAVSLGAHKSAGTMPAMLWQHDPDDPIGVWLEMTEDAKGLRVKGQLCLDTTCGKEAYALLKMGALKGLSIGFISKAWEYDTGTGIRTLTQVDLWEVSLVTFPANQASNITQVKAAPDNIVAPKDAERILRDAGFSKSDALAFVSRVMRMGEERSESAKSTARALRAADRLTALLTS